MSIEKIKKTTIVEQVMEQIKALIASGAYKSGDKIPTELELAESFGVGRSTIREAIKIFNHLILKLQKLLLIIQQTMSFLLKQKHLLLTLIQ